MAGSASRSVPRSLSPNFPRRGASVNGASQLLAGYRSRRSSGNPSPLRGLSQVRREELPAGTFGDLEQQEVLLAKTADRSVLGCINDMAFRCVHVIAGAGGLARTDLAELNRSLRRNINSARGYCPHVELAARRLAV